MWDACGLFPGQANKELDCTPPTTRPRQTSPTRKLLYILVHSPFGLSGCFHIGILESAQEGVFPRKMGSTSTAVPDSVLEVPMPSATQGSQHRALSVPGQQTSNPWGLLPL